MYFSFISPFVRDNSKARGSYSGRNVVSLLRLKAVASIFLRKARLFYEQYMSILCNAYDYLPPLKRNNFRASCESTSTDDFFFFRYSMYLVKM